MKNVNIKTALTAVTLAAAALATSLPAHAGEYNRKCKDTNNAVAGGLIGGSVGAAIGEGIAGRGDNTEGAVLGAIIGGIAGAAIGDGVNDCEKDKRYNQRGYITTQHYPTRTTNSHRGYQTVGHHGNNRNRGYSHNRGYNRTSYGYGNRRGDRLFQIDRRIDELRHERAYLKDERRRSRGYRPGIERRLDRIAWRLDELKRERKRIKKGHNRRHDYRQTRRGHYHGSSRNLCYSAH